MYRHYPIDRDVYPDYPIDRDMCPDYPIDRDMYPGRKFPGHSSPLSRQRVQRA